MHRFLFSIDLKDHVNFIDINNVCNMPLYEKNAKAIKKTHILAHNTVRSNYNTSRLKNRWCYLPPPALTVLCRRPLR